MSNNFATMTTSQRSMATKVVFLWRVLYLAFPTGGIRIVRFWYEKPPKSVSGCVVCLNLATNCDIFIENMAAPKAVLNL